MNARWNRTDLPRSTLIAGTSVRERGGTKSTQICQHELLYASHAALDEVSTHAGGGPPMVPRGGGGSRGGPGHDAASKTNGKMAGAIIRPLGIVTPF